MFHLLPHWIFPPPRQAVSSPVLTHKGSLAQHNTAFPRAHRTCAAAQNAPHQTSFHSHRQIHTRTTQSRNCKTTDTSSVALSRPRLINDHIGLVTHTNVLRPHTSSRCTYTHSQTPRGAVISFSHQHHRAHSKIHDPETRPRHHTSDSVTKTHTEPPTHTPSHTTSSATTHFKHTVMALHLTLRPTRLDTQSHAALGPRLPRPHDLPQPHSHAAAGTYTQVYVHTSVLAGRVLAAPIMTAVPAAQAPSAYVRPSGIPGGTMVSAHHTWDS